MLEAWEMLVGIGQAARHAQRQVTRPESVPFTLVTGFLGSGKTTLVQNILTKSAGQRIAVLVNDFGSISIDAALIRSKTANTIELANGCACCNLSAGLANTLAELLSSPRPPEAVILEASGLAEPEGILHVALSHPAIRLNGVIAVADAENLGAQLRSAPARPTIERQIAGSDIVILNKADVVGPATLAEARERIAEIAPRIPVRNAVHADVPNELLFGIEFGARTATDAAPMPHDNPFESWTLASDGDLDERRFCALADELPATIFRAKGFVRLASDATHRHLFQLVGRRWSLTRDERWTGPERRTEIVIIGTASAEESEALALRFEQCEVAAAPVGAASQR